MDPQTDRAEIYGLAGWILAFIGLSAYRGFKNDTILTGKDRMGIL